MARASSCFPEVPSELLRGVKDPDTTTLLAQSKAGPVKMIIHHDSTVSIIVHRREVVNVRSSEYPSCSELEQEGGEV